MSMDHDRSELTEGDRVLVGEFALGLLDAAAHRRLLLRIADESALADELWLWQQRLADLDPGFEEQPAPAGLYARIENRVFGGPAQRTGWAAFWHSIAMWRGLAVASLAVAVFAIAFLLAQPARIDPEEFATQLVAALQSQEGSGIEFVALYDTATGSVRLTALSGEVAPDRDLELWYIKGDEPAVSMGVIPVDARTTIPLSPDTRAKFEPGTVLAITLEQKGGSPTGVAQGPIVAVGTATAI